MSATMIVIEGLTGSGKSTVADALAARRGFERPSLIPAEWKAAHEAVENDPTALDARYALFIAAILYQAAEVKAILERGSSVVVDSWHYRTMATHKSLGSTLNWELPAWIPLPQVSIFLDVDEATRAERVARRGRPSGYWKAQCEL